jgi:hypothetical protein
LTKPSDCLSIPLAVPPTWAEAPIQNRRLRPCRNGPENVSFHHSSLCENRGKSMSLAYRLGPLWPLSNMAESSHVSCSSAEVLWCGAEAAEMADAMIEAQKSFNFLMIFLSVWQTPPNGHTRDSSPSLGRESTCDLSIRTNRIPVPALRLCGAKGDEACG